MHLKNGEWYQISGCAQLPQYEGVEGVQNSKHNPTEIRLIRNLKKMILYVRTYVLHCIYVSLR